MKRMQICLYLTASLAIAVWHGVAGAMPANPNVVIAEQPDGTKVALRIHGDEKFNWQADLNGYPVERKPDGVYVYAAPAGAAEAARADLVVGKADPAAAGVKKGVPPRPRVKGLARPDRLAAPAGAEPAKRIAPTGAV